MKFVIPSMAGGLLLFSTVVGPAPARAEEFKRHVVVAQEAHAAAVGRDILRAGGNAVDAAIATAFALAVTHPAAGNLGGGGFLVLHLADTGQVTTFDFREAAPAVSTPTMYLDEHRNELPGHRLGARAAGVPGTVRGLALAHQRYGRLPWKTLIEPSIRLARDGFPLSGPLARSLNSQLFNDAPSLRPAEDLGGGSNRMASFPSSLAAYQHPDARSWAEGDVIRLPDLAATLERIAEQGPDEFYVGRTAALIADYCQANGGLITREDLAAYRAVERPPIHTRFRGHDVYGVSPPSSGGVVLGLALAQLEGRDLSAGPESDQSLHWITEAMRRAYFVRATTLSDPRSLPVPVEILTSPTLVKSLSHSTRDQATPSADLATFLIADDPGEGTETTHLSVVDDQGNAVALTYTLEEGYGSKAVVANAGFLLNNEMGDFNLVPGRTDRVGRIGTRPNRIGPRKRMLSSQTPTIVLRDGRVRIVTGSPGGRTIPNTVLWVLLRSLVFEESPEAVVRGSRTHHSWLPDVLYLEGDAWPEATRETMRRRGHVLGRREIQGDAHTILVDQASGGINGVADPRHLVSSASGD